MFMRISEALLSKLTEAFHTWQSNLNSLQKVKQTMDKIDGPLDNTMFYLSKNSLQNVIMDQNETPKQQRNKHKSNKGKET